MRVGCIIAASYLVLLIFAMIFEDSLIYFPAKLDSKWKPLYGIEECFFSAADGTKLHGVYLRPTPNSKVLLWFHGNAGNLEGRIDMMYGFLKKDIGVFLIDYHGYGKSEGKPSEKGIYDDSTAAYNFLINEKKLLPKDIVIFGKSLGGGPATDLAARVPCAGLILQSTFTSIPDMAKGMFPFSLVAWAARTKFDNLSKIGNVRVPKLHIHSPADEVVPFKLGRKLFEAAPEPKQFYEVPGAGHNETYIVGGASYFSRVAEFVSSLPR